MTKLIIISGGQTGVDQAALRAARKLNLQTGGWAPKGWETEDGPAPWLADYGLKECEVSGYPARTEANVRDADITLWFGERASRGFAATSRACLKHGIYLMINLLWPVTDALSLHEIIWRSGVETYTINIAGNRESGNPGVGAKAEEYFTKMLKELDAAMVASGLKEADAEKEGPTA